MLCQSIRPLIDPKVLEHCFYLINHVRARLTLLNQKMPWYELCRLWGQFQRYWLELAGMQQYLRRTVDPMALYQDASPLPVDCFVGAFTDDRIVAKSLSTAGVPVWLIIPSESVDGDVPIIRAHVYPSPPPLIAPSLGNGLSPRSAWNSLGLIARGDPKSIVLRRQSDDQFMPNSSALEIQNAPTSSRAELGSIERGLHLSKMGGRQETPPRPTKRHQPYGPNPTHVIRVRPIQAESPQQLQPPLRFQRPVVLPEWSAALLEIEHLETARKAHRFWMPIGTFFNEDNPMRRERALINWLAVRESWFGHLAQSGLEGEPQLDREDWRHFLSHIPERGAFQRRRKNLAIFDQLLPQGAPVISPDESTLPYQWFNRLYDRGGDAKELILTQRLIMWELDELSFRIECLSLQGKISENAKHSEDERQVYRKQLASAWEQYDMEHGLYFKSAPSEDRGIGSVIWNYSVPAIEAIRQVIASWPGAPESIKASLVIPVESNTIPVVQSLRTALARFFCQTYHSQFSRFPMLPTQFPIPYVFDSKCPETEDEH
ncbi:hypothetical protein SISNIDRAFT_485487 [Sistotremastrum niveocremeum HHB9708]|uniref:Uncharacterized protein n=1 Tax=Sistotremastrum niveocremeum HHB9708 TaxID=1314777 RepID=A0A164V7J6_9AGAM|nr:hypothetical protein SISNIDRAFT_485487 [Sistotremastrum niveocremeum HHB9708]